MTPPSLPKYRQTPNHKTEHQAALHKPCFSGLFVELEDVADVEVASLQPHHPGVLQEVEDEGVELDDELTAELLGVELAVELVVIALLPVAGASEVVVTIGAGAAEGEVMVVVSVIVLGSLQPNQPGVLQVVVVSVLVIVVVGVCDVVVDSSRQPHQPGVLQVSVRVCEVVLEETVVLLVVVSLLLLSKNVQLKQS